MDLMLYNVGEKMRLADTGRAFQKYSLGIRKVPNVRVERVLYLPK